VVTDKAAVQADSRELATLAARIASEKQADAILVLDVRELITITDYFVIASGASERQAKTVTEEIVKEKIELLPLEAVDSNHERLRMPCANPKTVAIIANATTAGVRNMPGIVSGGSPLR